MAKIPTYQGEVIQQGGTTKLSGQDFVGSALQGLGKSIGQVGSVMAEYGMRQQQANDVLASNRHKNLTNNYNAQLNMLLDQGKFEDAEALRTSFDQAVRSDEIINKASGKSKALIFGNQDFIVNDGYQGAVNTGKIMFEQKENKTRVKSSYDQFIFQNDYTGARQLIDQSIQTGILTQEDGNDWLRNVDKNESIFKDNMAAINSSVFVQNGDFEGAYKAADGIKDVLERERVRITIAGEQQKYAQQELVIKLNTRAAALSESENVAGVITGLTDAFAQFDKEADALNMSPAQKAYTKTTAISSITRLDAQNVQTMQEIDKAREFYNELSKTGAIDAKAAVNAMQNYNAAGNRITRELSAVRSNILQIGRQKDENGSPVDITQIVEANTDYFKKILGDAEGDVFAQTLIDENTRSNAGAVFKSANTQRVAIQNNQKLAAIIAAAEDGDMSMGDGVRAIMQGNFDRKERIAAVAYMSEAVVDDVIPAPDKTPATDWERSSYMINARKIKGHAKELNKIYQQHTVESGDISAWVGYQDDLEALASMKTARERTAYIETARERVAILTNDILSEQTRQNAKY